MHIKQIILNNRKDWVLIILRIIPSFFMFYYHGYNKIINGVDTWNWLGGAVLTIFSISIGHTFIGFLAALSEGILTWFIIIGFKTRVASFFNMMTMLFAGIYHLNKAESGESAFIYCVIFFTILILGPGTYSIDNILEQRKINLND